MVGRVRKWLVDGRESVLMAISVAGFRGVPTWHNRAVSACHTVTCLLVVPNRQARHQ